MNARPYSEKRRANRRLGDRRADTVKTEATNQTLVIDDRQKLVRIGDRQVRLTPKEFKLLKLLASEPGRVFSSDEIVKDAWDSRSRASVADAQQYIHLLRKKVETDPKQPQLIITVSGFGYRLAIPGSE
jgi:DNA-binding response OmpR family regulator